jgi:hypothetical protein
MSFGFALGVLIAALFVLRQTRIRPVPRVWRAGATAFLGVIGLFDLFAYTGDHNHISGADWAWVVGTLLVGAVLLGAVRAMTVRLWTTSHWVLRQGTPFTVVLLLATLALHFFVDDGGGHVGASGLARSSLLLYLALTFGVQSYVIHLRAAPLWRQLGPDAGPRLSFNFGAGPGGSMRTFFTNFDGSTGGFGAAAPGGGAPARRPAGGDVIDAEVVDDDSPELPQAP